MWSIHRLSLFTRLLAPFVLVVTIAFAVEAWLVIRVGERAIDVLVMENLSARARDRFAMVDQFFADRTRELKSWCALSLMDDVLVQDRVLSIENFLLERRRERPHLYSSLTVLDRSETVIASTELSSLGSSLRIAGLTPYVAPGGETRWSALPSAASAGPPVMRVAEPISSRLSPEPIGWLVASIPWNVIEQIVERPKGDSRESRAELFFLLVDASGTVVAGDRTHSDASGRLAIGDDYLIVTHHASAEARTSTPELGVVAAWDKHKAFNVDRVFVAVVLASTALGVLLATGVSFAIARYITGRLRELVEGTALVARGELSYRVDEGPDDEFGELARAFNLMGGELAVLRDGLEGAVARWKSLVTHAPDVILTVDRDGTILFINRVLSGLTVDRVIGTNVDRYVPAEYAQVLRNAIDRAFQTGDLENLEIEGAGPDDSTAWYSSRIGPVRREGAIVAVIIITTDITERKRLEQEVLEIAEFERARIGRDLHDGLGQSLTGIALLSKGLEQQLAVSTPAQADQAKQIGVLIGETIGQTRTLAQGLFPSALEHAGLLGAVEELVVVVERVYGISCRVRIATGAAPEDRSHTTHLFRIIQEAVNNAVRHAQARHIAIVLLRRTNCRLLAIRDDGIGFPERAARHEGMGLRSMRYRASVLGGTLELRGNRRRGAAVVCRFS